MLNVGINFNLLFFLRHLGPDRARTLPLLKGASTNKQVVIDSRTHIQHYHTTTLLLLLLLLFLLLYLLLLCCFCPYSRAVGIENHIVFLFFVYACLLFVISICVDCTQLQYNNSLAN